MAEHTCHPQNCTRTIHPSLLMCGKHWRMVSQPTQRLVWKHFRAGQEVDKKPSRESVEAMRKAIQEVAEQEQLPLFEATNPKGKR